MTMPADNAPDLLCAELLAEATRQQQALLDAAHAEARQWFAATEAEMRVWRERALTSAQERAATRAAAILATVEGELRQQESARIEEWLETVRQGARQQLLARAYPARVALPALAFQAASRMTGALLTLTVETADQDLLDAHALAELARRTGRIPTDFTVMLSDNPPAGGGVLVEDQDGRQRWDNRMLPRLERLWPELRRQIARQCGLCPKEPASATGAQL
jgi:vacuolar-type H+-ATPase subunit E/Vma4